MTEAAGLAERAAEVAAHGGDAVGEAVQRMDAIHQQSRRIAEIIGVIDGIAFQTNILSLNAAVEAARAGEQGRGFAVVASEVRALAQRSSGAARDIRSLINDSVEQIDAGSGVVRQAGQTMRDIVEAAGRVSTMMSGITRATTTQAHSLQGIQSAVVAMDNATQQNAALVEEATAATQSLKVQVGGLVNSIAAFRT